MTPSSDPVNSLKKKRRLPRSFRELTPSNHFNPRTFFHEMVWKALLTRRTGECKEPAFPKLTSGQVAVTWIGHASFLVQFTDLNVLIDPNFANWLFLLKRLKRAGIKFEHLPPIDLVLLTHAHFDHFHRPTLKRLPSPKIGVMPWGMGDLAHNVGFDRVIELQWWESFLHGEWKVTLTPTKHWGARVIRDEHRGYGGFMLEHQGRRIFHAGDSAYYPDSFRHTHMGPDEAVKVFEDLNAKWMVPMHYGTFKLSFEEMDEPLRWLCELAKQHRIDQRVRIMEEGVPEVF